MLYSNYLDAGRGLGSLPDESVMVVILRRGLCAEGSVGCIRRLWNIGSVSVVERGSFARRSGLRMTT
jgi:hypothetical protein